MVQWIKRTSISIRRMQRPSFTWAGGVSLDIGKFAGPLGAEVSESSGDWYHSRSFLFWHAVPAFHAFSSEDAFINGAAGPPRTTGYTPALTTVFEFQSDIIRT